MSDLLFDFKPAFGLSSFTCVLACFGSSSNRAQYISETVDHLFVAESKHLATVLLQVFGSSLVVLLLFLVMCSVDLDDEAVLRTAEVEDVWTDGILATELETVEPTAPNCFPEN